jgi:hypothetical protein
MKSILAADVLTEIDQKLNFTIFVKSHFFWKTVSDVFHDLKNVKIAKKGSKIGQLLPIVANAMLATFYELKITFWKKLVEGADITYFQLDIYESTCSCVSEIRNKIFLRATIPSAWCEALINEIMYY